MVCVQPPQVAGRWLCWCKPVSTGTMRLAAGRLAEDNPEKKEQKKKKQAGYWRLTLAESRSYIHQRPQLHVAHYSLISNKTRARTYTLAELGGGGRGSWAMVR